MIPLLPDQRTILDLCSGTGSWSQPYLDAGYEVLRVEIKDGADTRLWPAPMSEQPRLPDEFPDVRQLNIHGVLAAPVCTVFAGSGARWPRTDEDVREGLALVDACLRICQAVDPVWWVMENPVGKLAKWIGNPVDSFQPSDYGDPYTKKTLLWGRFTMPEQTPVEAVDGSKLWRNYGGKSDKTKTERSVTPHGFAQAFFKANP